MNCHHMMRNVVSLTNVNRIYRLAICILVILVAKQILYGSCELYTSVDQLAKLKETANHYSNLINYKLDTLHSNLEQLNKLTNSIEEMKHIINRTQNFADHPIKALKVVHSLVKTRKLLDGLRLADSRISITLSKTTNKLALEEDEYEEDYDEDENNDYSATCSNCLSVSQTDLVGCAEALLRLQKFYDLNALDLLTGMITSNIQQENLSTLRYQTDNSLKLNSEDCIILGKTAYGTGDYKNAMVWLELALSQKSIKNNSDKDIENDRFKIDVLEYMAFSAYKMGRIKQAFQITQKWLSLEPDNQRAGKNLFYYRHLLDELERKRFNEKLRFLEGDLSIRNNRKTRRKKRSETLKLIEDDKIDLFSGTTKSLCKGRDIKMININEQICLKQELISETVKGFKLEILNAIPKIIRVHDFLTDAESSTLIEQAMPKLFRSTIQTNEGIQIESEHRIAKTAWLSTKIHRVVEVITDRISQLLGLSIQNSEDIQVVNYGLGGFYGPHYDATRGHKDDNELNNNTQVNGRSYNRIATILIYLSDVELGGATVFPRLNLTIEPIKNSAVIWFNLDKNGFSDQDTLHASCPVLIGSKWIATKWISEEANIFIRPCNITRGIEKLD